MGGKKISISWLPIDHRGASYLKMFDQCDFYRKFLAGIVQGLHLTPGRRFRSSLVKLRHALPFQNPPDPFMQALVDLLKDEGWTNSLEDLGVAVKAVKDEDDLILTTNVDRLLQRIVRELLWCSDYKVADMGHRHELKFVVKKSYHGCPHNIGEVVKHKCYPVTLQLEALMVKKVCDVQAALERSLKTECEVKCKECNKTIVKCVKQSIYPWSDPDFLTIHFKEPQYIQEKDLRLNLGQSFYGVKSVVHWDEERKKSGKKSRTKLKRFHFLRHPLQDQKCLVLFLTSSFC